MYVYVCLHVIASRRSSFLKIEKQHSIQHHLIPQPFVIGIYFQLNASYVFLCRQNGVEARRHAADVGASHFSTPPARLRARVSQCSPGFSWRGRVTLRGPLAPLPRPAAHAGSVCSAE